MKKLILSSCILLFVMLSSCASTKIVNSWMEPNKEITIKKLKKVLVVAMFNNETSNHKAEDQMVSYLEGRGIPSYNYLNNSFDKTRVEAIQNKIKKDGFDGAVTMRLIDVDKETLYQKNGLNRYPNNYRDFSNYYYDSSISYNNPENYVTTKTYTIETNIYSITENKIIWSALTETTDPKGVKKLTEEVSKVVYKQMLKDGFIK